MPCQRCVRTGRSAHCSFEAVAEQPLQTILQRDQQIQDLQSEVAKLKTLLSETRPAHGGDDTTEASQLNDARPRQPTLLDGTAIDANPNTSKRVAETSRRVDNTQPSSPLFPRSHLDQDSTNVGNTDPLDPRGRSPPGYYSRHTLFQFFSEVGCSA